MKSYASAAVRLFLSSTIALSFAACTKTVDVTAAAPPAQLAFGDWGGTQADVNATSSEVHVVLGCAFGDFPGVIALDASGRFLNVSGSWNRSTGPIQVNGAMPAVLSGQAVGNYLTFAVAVNDTINKQISSLGPATVVFGRQATSTVCPL